MKDVILDVDTGIDDALALIYAVKSKELNVLGITTCFGNVTVEQSYENTLEVLGLLDFDCPVANGAQRPLFRQASLSTAADVHGEDGLAGVPKSRSAHHRASELNARQFIINEIKKKPGQVNLICLGPLTNLASAILQEPEVMRQVEHVYIMGGAIKSPGNITATSEANMYTDPEAAAVVFKSGLPITLIGLDVTTQAILQRDDVERWKANPNELNEGMAHISEYYLSYYEKTHPSFGGAPLHDPLAVGVAIDDSIVETQHLYVQVDVDGLYSLGRTVADFRDHCQEKPNVHVCLTLDKERFLQHFHATVC